MGDSGPWRRVGVKMRNTFNDRRGQTVIETLFMLIILLAIFLLIAEVARAWHLKNSLNNAARVGARFAVVQTDLEENDPDVVQTVRDTLGRPDAEVFVNIIDLNSSGGDPDAGDMVMVTVRDCFIPVVRWELGFISDDPALECDSAGMFLTSITSMRYEI